MKIITLIVLVLTAVLATGCSMAEEPNSYSEQGKTTKEAPTTSTHKKTPPKWVGHMNSISLGMSEAEVKSILGKPTDTTSSEMQGFEGGTTTMDMWTYGDMFTNTDGNDIWMLSFTDGNLESKSRI